MNEPRKKPKSCHVAHVCPVKDKLGESSVTYQLEYIQCGKKRCRKWHWPYWYAYWTAGGRSRSLYIGKTLKPAATVAVERLQRARSRRAAA